MINDFMNKFITSINGTNLDIIQWTTSTIVEVFQITNGMQYFFDFSWRWIRLCQQHHGNTYKHFFCKIFMIGRPWSYVHDEIVVGRFRSSFRSSILKLPWLGCFTFAYTVLGSSNFGWQRLSTSKCFLFVCGLFWMTLLLVNIQYHHCFE